MLTTEEVTPPGLQAWARQYARRLGRRLGPVPGAGARAGQRRLVVVHLDGVALGVLREAMAAGRMPFLERLVRSGAYHLDSAFWGTPASTPAFQAGLLYGLRHPDLPGYSWFDRELGRRVIMNKPRDASAIDARLGRHRGRSLLEGGGHTYFSLFRAGAANRLCMSSLAEGSALVRARTLREEFRGVLLGRTRSPLAYAGQLATEALGACCEVSRWARGLGDWRHERAFLMSRVLLQRLGWSYALTRTAVDMVRGVPVVYLVFGNYDEVAHRRGPRSPMALGELHRADAHFAELYALSRAVEGGPYDIVFVSDHGHVGSEPLERRGGGARLADVLLDGPPIAPAPDVVRGLLAGRPPPVGRWQGPPGAPWVEEAGNFAHVYLQRGRTPLEAAEVLARHPEVLGRAAAHPDIGLVMLRRRDEGVAVVQGGVYGAREVESAPLPPGFSRRAVADALRELPHLAQAGDLVLYGEALAGDATVGFAWEFGSHGGLTRTEVDSLVLWPAGAPLDLGALGHVTQLHERLADVYRN